MSLEASTKSSSNQNISRNKITRMYWTAFDDFKSSATPNDILEAMSDTNIKSSNSLISNNNQDQEPQIQQEKLFPILKDAITKHYSLFFTNNDLNYDNVYQELLKEPEVVIVSATWSSFPINDGNVYGYQVKFLIKNKYMDISDNSKTVNIYYSRL